MDGTPFRSSLPIIRSQTPQDQLLADFTPERLSKLEVYTFASAANHFSAPLTGKCEAPFSRVEHFANENDFVSRIGKSLLFD
jgi:hypothetical protein